MPDLIKGNAARLAWGKITIPELHKKFTPQEVVLIVEECARFIELDITVKQWAKEGVTFWE